MHLCEKCQKRRHVIQKFKKEKGKHYLITLCAVCKSGLDIEEVKDTKEGK